MRLATLAVLTAMTMTAGCRSESFDGVYVGELRSESFRSDGTTIPENADMSSETDLNVKVARNGDRVTIEIARSRLLGDCELFLKVSKNGSAYFETPQTCTRSLPLEGSMSGQNGELNLVMRGFDASTSTTFRFKGFKN